MLCWWTTWEQLIIDYFLRGLRWFLSDDFFHASMCTCWVNRILFWDITWCFSCLLSSVVVSSTLIVPFIIFRMKGQEVKEELTKERVSFEVQSQRLIVLKSKQEKTKDPVRVPSWKLQIESLKGMEEEISELKRIPDKVKDYFCGTEKDENFCLDWEKEKRRKRTVSWREGLWA